MSHIDPTSPEFERLARRILLIEHIETVDPESPFLRLCACGLVFPDAEAHMKHAIGSLLAAAQDPDQ